MVQDGVVAPRLGRTADLALGRGCLLYTSDAADDLLSVDPGGRRLIKKKKNNHTPTHHPSTPPRA